MASERWLCCRGAFRKRPGEGGGIGNTGEALSGFRLKGRSGGGRGHLGRARAGDRGQTRGLAAAVEDSQEERLAGSERRAHGPAGQGGNAGEATAPNGARRTGFRPASAGSAGCRQPAKKTPRSGGSALRSGDVFCREVSG